MQAKVSEKAFKAFEAFKQQLANVWSCMHLSMANNPCKSLPKEIIWVMCSSDDKIKCV